MNNKLPISIVIPTLNRPKALERTLSSIMSFKDVPSQIIVVDQSDNQKDKKRNEKILNKYNNVITCTYIYQEKPSLTKARNTGMEHCKYDIVICSDDDVDVNSDTLFKVHDVMQDGKISMIGGINKHLNPGKSKIGYLSYTKSYRKRKIGHVTLSLLGRFPLSSEAEYIETEWAMGFFFVVRKSLVDAWNLKWDENLVSYAYPEDLDFSYTYYKQSKEEGLKCIMHNSIKVNHWGTEEHRIPPYKSTLMYVIHREYLSYKHFENPMSRVATRWTNLNMFFFRLIKKQKPLDLLKAQYVCDKNRKDLRKGIIPENIIKKLS